MAAKTNKTTTINIILWEAKTYYQPSDNLEVAIGITEGQSSTQHQQNFLLTD